MISKHWLWSALKQKHDTYCISFFFSALSTRRTLRKPKMKFNDEYVYNFNESYALLKNISKKTKIEPPAPSPSPPPSEEPAPLETVPGHPKVHLRQEEVSEYRCCYCPHRCLTYDLAEWHFLQLHEGKVAPKEQDAIVNKRTVDFRYSKKRLQNVAKQRVQRKITKAKKPGRKVKLPVEKDNAAKKTKSKSPKSVEPKPMETLTEEDRELQALMEEFMQSKSKDSEPCPCNFHKNCRAKNDSDKMTSPSQGQCTASSAHHSSSRVVSQAADSNGEEEDESLLGIHITHVQGADGTHLTDTDISQATQEIIQLERGPHIEKEVLEWEFDKDTQRYQVQVEDCTISPLKPKRVCRVPSMDNDVDENVQLGNDYEEQGEHLVDLTEDKSNDSVNDTVRPGPVSGTEVTSTAVQPVVICPSEEKTQEAVGKPRSAKECVPPEMVSQCARAANVLLQVMINEAEKQTSPRAKVVSQSSSEHGDSPAQLCGPTPLNIMPQSGPGEQLSPPSSNIPSVTPINITPHCQLVSQLSPPLFNTPIVTPITITPNVTPINITPQSDYVNQPTPPTLNKPSGTAINITPQCQPMNQSATPILNIHSFLPISMASQSQLVRQPSPPSSNKQNVTPQSPPPSSIRPLIIPSQGQPFNQPLQLRRVGSGQATKLLQIVPSQVISGAGVSVINSQILTVKGVVAENMFPVSTAKTSPVTGSQAGNSSVLSAVWRTLAGPSQPAQTVCTVPPTTAVTPSTSSTTNSVANITSPCLSVTAPLPSTSTPRQATISQLPSTAIAPPIPEDLGSNPKVDKPPGLVSPTNLSLGSPPGLVTLRNIPPGSLPGLVTPRNISTGSPPGLVTLRNLSPGTLPGLVNPRNLSPDSPPGLVTPINILASVIPRSTANTTSRNTLSTHVQGVPAQQQSSNAASTPGISPPKDSNTVEPVQPSSQPSQVTSSPCSNQRNSSTISSQRKITHSDDEPDDNLLSKKYNGECAHCGLVLTSIRAMMLHMNSHQETSDSQEPVSPQPGLSSPSSIAAHITQPTTTASSEDNMKKQGVSAPQHSASDSGVNARVLVAQNHAVPPVCKPSHTNPVSNTQTSTVQSLSASSGACRLSGNSQVITQLSSDTAPSASGPLCQLTIPGQTQKVSVPFSAILNLVQKGVLKVNAPPSQTPVIQTTPSLANLVPPSTSKPAPATLANPAQPTAPAPQAFYQIKLMDGSEKCVIMSATQMNELLAKGVLKMNPAGQGSLQINNNVSHGKSSLKNVLSQQPTLSAHQTLTPSPRPAGQEMYSVEIRAGKGPPSQVASSNDHTSSCAVSSSASGTDPQESGAPEENDSSVTQSDSSMQQVAQAAIGDAVSTILHAFKSGKQTQPPNTVASTQTSLSGRTSPVFPGFKHVAGRRFSQPKVPVMVVRPTNHGSSSQTPDKQHRKSAKQGTPGRHSQRSEPHRKSGRIKKHTDKCVCILCLNKRYKTGVLNTEGLTEHDSPNKRKTAKRKSLSKLSTSISKDLSRYVQRNQQGVDSPSSHISVSSRDTDTQPGDSHTDDKEKERPTHSPSSQVGDRSADLESDPAVNIPTTQTDAGLSHNERDTLASKNAELDPSGPQPRKSSIPHGGGTKSAKSKIRQDFNRSHSVTPTTDLNNHRKSKRGKRHGYKCICVKCAGQQKARETSTAPDNGEPKEDLQSVTLQVLGKQERVLLSRDLVGDSKLTMTPVVQVPDITALLSL